MRDKNFRRKQEAKHFKKRLEMSIALKRYKKYIDENGNIKLLPTNEYKHYEPWIFDKNNIIIKNENKRWKFALKNNSMPSEISSYQKRYCRRCRRHFQKMVEYKIPDKKFLVRGDILNYEDRVSLKYENKFK